MKPGIATVLIALAAAAGCGGSSSPTAPAPVTGLTGTSWTLSPDARAALERGLDDEYKAEMIYQGVVNDLGAPVPFVGVLQSEQQHAAAIAQMFVRRGLPVPANAWSTDRIPRFASVPAACASAEAAERETVAMYDELLRLDLPADVRMVFTNVRAASLWNHLPAFEWCATTP